MRVDQKYCPSMTRYQRLETKDVRVGNIGIGGNNPIRLQSMTTTDTMDTQASVEQAVRMINAGCELVRYTAPSKKEAENLAKIKASLAGLGYDTPLVADIHFTPNAAEVAALHIEKVRVNPGNYADKKKFEVHDYTDKSYKAELERIREKFTPLVLLCKKLGRAMRIGTNHGSLSDRILSRYGDTPLGMVESALEFVQICEDNDYHDLIISMKASNPQVMVQAYRMLVHRMMERGKVYPLHVGVTEAGEGEDGRIKSAVGIGTLLEDGIGDTIRVSLTEEPEAEIPVARLLAERYEKRIGRKMVDFQGELPYDPFSYERRKTKTLLNIGGSNVPVVLADLSQIETLKPAHLFAHGYTYQVADDKWKIGEQAVDYIYTGNKLPDFKLPGTISVICDAEVWKEDPQTYPLFNSRDYFTAEKRPDTLIFIRFNTMLIRDVQRLKNVSNLENIVLILYSENEHAMPEIRRFIAELMLEGIDVPVIIERRYSGLTTDAFQLYASTDAGGLLLDGMGDGVFLSGNDAVPAQIVTSTAFGILQATRTRISKTEYISCPSCGRTLFDLQETTAKIRSRTNHLKGLKIGIMGCIVNGPGEMADADYGYVGVGKGKINLYKEKEVVKRNIPEEDALDELIALIQENGEWIDPKD